MQRLSNYIRHYSCTYRNNLLLHLQFISQIIEDFLELMYRCMFLAPLSLVQSCLSPQPPVQLKSPLSSPDNQSQLEKSESPLLATQFSKCTSARADSGDIFVESEGGDEGFMLFRPKLTNGKYTWKVRLLCEILEKLPYIRKFKLLNY